MTTSRLFPRAVLSRSVSLALAILLLGGITASVSATGEAPTQEELRVMLEDERAARKARGQPEPSATPTPIAVRQHPSGMRSAVLGRDFLISIQAQRRTDGTVEISHTDPAHEHPTAKSQRPTE